MRTTHFRRMNLRLLLALAIIAILATAAYGFAAGNTVPGSQAGDGSGDISGYTVSNITYTLAEDPTILESVGFSLEAPATTVKVSMNDGGNWDSCTAGSTANSWKCDITSWSAPVKTVTKLRVVAVQ